MAEESEGISKTDGPVVSVSEAAPAALPPATDKEREALQAQRDTVSTRLTELRDNAALGGVSMPADNRLIENQEAKLGELDSRLTAPPMEHSAGSGQGIGRRVLSAFKALARRS
jgi:hypothetical protein